jgi:hypothetical protein
VTPNYVFAGPWQYREMIVVCRHLTILERIGMLFNTGLRGAELQRYAARLRI